MFSSSDVIINIPKSEGDEEKENFYNIQYDSALISESDRYEDAIKKKKKKLCNTRYDRTFAFLHLLH
jgi:hypothetical protein